MVCHESVTGDVQNIKSCSRGKLKKNVELKFMHVNVPKSVTRMTKRGGDIQTDQISTQTGLVIQYADVTIHEVSEEFEAAFP